MRTSSGQMRSKVIALPDRATQLARVSSRRSWRDSISGTTALTFRLHQLGPITAWSLLFASLLLSGLLGPVERLQAQQSFGVPIQLPTQSFFGVNTTVSVPDGGSISLGGNSGGAWSSIRRGGFGPPFANRAFGGTQFAHNASVHVQVLSQMEMEAELLSQLPPGRSLADYARPTPPRLLLSEPDSRASTSLSSSTAQAGSSARDADFKSRSNRSVHNPPAGRAPAATLDEQPVDPNGSRAIQDKADFMSRHIGRKKK